MNSNSLVQLVIWVNPHYEENVVYYQSVDAAMLIFGDFKLPSFLCAQLGIEYCRKSIRLAGIGPSDSVCSDGFALIRPEFLDRQTTEAFQSLKKLVQIPVAAFHQRKLLATDDIEMLKRK